MTEVKKEGSVMPESYNSTIGYNLFDRPLLLTESLEMPLKVPESGFEPIVGEMHWMAFAAYNQSK